MRTVRPAVVKSCAKMDHLKTGGTLLNQKFTPAVVAGESRVWIRPGESVSARISIWMVITFSSMWLTGRLLRDAQAHPDDYKDLIVRVAGYSDYFRNLSKELQDRDYHENRAELLINKEVRRRNMSCKCMMRTSQQECRSILKS